MIRTFIIATASLLLVIAQPVFAISLQELIDSRERPTMLEVAEAVNWDFSRSPFDEHVDNSTSDDHLIKMIETEGPEMIVQLERAYPKAIWVPLGRDAAIAGDFLDAFYLTHGQRGRVVRINASSGSFMNSFPLIDLFKTLDLVDDHGIPKKRFVILDRTRYRPRTRQYQCSQVRALVSSVFNQIQGKRKYSFLSEVGIIALNLGHAEINRDFDPDHFQKGLSIDKSGPSHILSTSVLLSDSTPWHDTFGPFYKDSSGQVRTRPGALSSKFTRKGILESMVKILKIVKSNAFMDKLKEINQSYGGPLEYEFLSFCSLDALFKSIQEEHPSLGFIENQLAALKKSYYLNHETLEARVLETHLLVGLALSGQIPGFYLKGTDPKQIELEEARLLQDLSRTLASMSDKGLKIFLRDFDNLSTGIKIKFNRSSNRELARLLVKAMENAAPYYPLSLLKKNRFQVIDRWIHFLDPSRFEAALLNANSSKELTSLINELDSPSDAQKEVLERQLIHIGSYLNQVSTLIKLYTMLSPGSQRGIIRLFLNQDLTIDQLLTLHQSLFSTYSEHLRLLNLALENAFALKHPDPSLLKIISYLESNQEIDISWIEPSRFLAVSSNLQLMKQISHLLARVGLKEKHEEFIASLINTVDQDISIQWNILQFASPLLTQPLGASLSKIIGDIIQFELPFREAAPHSITLATLLRLNPFYLDLAFSMAQSEQDWIDLFKVVGPFNTEQGKMLEKHVKKVLELRENRTLMIQAYLAFSPQERRNDFLTILLNSVFSPQESILFLQDLAQLEESKLNIDLPIHNHLDHFFSLGPNVGQINQLINLAGFGGTTHLDILIKSLQVVQTREELKALVKFRTQEKNRTYRNALKEFKKRHPRTGRFSFLSRASARLSHLIPSIFSQNTSPAVQPEVQNAGI